MDNLKQYKQVIRLHWSDKDQKEEFLKKTKQDMLRQVSEELDFNRKYSVEFNYTTKHLTIKGEEFINDWNVEGIIAYYIEITLYLTLAE